LSYLAAGGRHRGASGNGLISRLGLIDKGLPLERRSRVCVSTEEIGKFAALFGNIVLFQNALAPRRTHGLDERIRRVQALLDRISEVFDAAGRRRL